MIVNAADLGRSPRAQFHAASLASHGWSVKVACMGGSSPFDHLVQHPRIEIQHLLDHGVSARGWVRLLQKGRGLKAGLERLLDGLPSVPESILVMTPPAIPIFGILQKWQKAHPSVPVIIDWHNLGHTKLAGGRGRLHPLVVLYRWFEYARWPRRTHHLAVSSALATHVSGRLGIDRVHVHRDDNPSWRVFPERDREAFVRRWSAELPDLDPSAVWIVHPHSWSRDEDPGSILTALSVTESKQRCQVFISGDGPLRDAFAERVKSSLDWQGRVLLPFLPPEGYLELLANADWGVCPHSSSSGIDLPMKLADMRAARLPALVYDYGPVLKEVFSEPEDGYFYRSEASLADLMGRILEGKLGRPSPRPSPGWEASWDQVVKPLMES